MELDADGNWHAMQTSESPAGAGGDWHLIEPSDMGDAMLSGDTLTPELSERTKSQFICLVNDTLPNYPQARNELLGLLSENRTPLDLLEALTKAKGATTSSNPPAQLQNVARLPPLDRARLNEAITRFNLKVWEGYNLTGR
jgi:hypothetical protein